MNTSTPQRVQSTKTIAVEATPGSTLQKDTVFAIITAYRQLGADLIVTFHPEITDNAILRQEARVTANDLQTTGTHERAGVVYRTGGAQYVEGIGSSGSICLATMATIPADHVWSGQGNERYQQTLL